MDFLPNICFDDFALLIWILFDLVRNDLWKLQKILFLHQIWQIQAISINQMSFYCNITYFFIFAISSKFSHHMTHIMNESLHPVNLAPLNSKTEVILTKVAVKMIEYTNFKYVQGPYILFARLLVLAAVPSAFDEGLNVLAFMQNFAPNINKHLSNLWDQRIPLLQHYLEQTKVFKAKSTNRNGEEGSSFFF